MIKKNCKFLKFQKFTVGYSALIGSFWLQDILQECYEQVDSALAASRRQCELNPKYSDHSSVDAQECVTRPGNLTEADMQSVGQTSECRQSHNTPTDVDMVVF